MGVRKLLPGEANRGVILFHQLETNRIAFFYQKVNTKISKSRGLRPRRPPSDAHAQYQLVWYKESFLN